MAVIPSTYQEFFVEVECLEKVRSKVTALGAQLHNKDKGKNLFLPYLSDVESTTTKVESSIDDLSCSLARERVKLQYAMKSRQSEDGQSIKERLLHPHQR